MLRGLLGGVCACIRELRLMLSGAVCVSLSWYGTLTLCVCVCVCVCVYVYVCVCYICCMYVFQKEYKPLLQYSESKGFFVITISRFPAIRDTCKTAVNGPEVVKRIRNKRRSLQR
jgi:hypothetical protein